MLARVVLIFKKGDTSLCENYRPISLLNSLYKIFARIMCVRIQSVIDPHFPPTQFGFRPGRSTADALHCCRRILTQARSTRDPTLCALLDWEKAFDKINHEKLFEALHRVNVPPQLLDLIKNIYNNGKFFVKTEKPKGGLYR